MAVFCQILMLLLRRVQIMIVINREEKKMADWVKIYDRAEDMELERLRKRAERRKAQQQAQQKSSQDTTGTTTMSQKEKPQD